MLRLSLIFSLFFFMSFPAEARIDIVPQKIVIQDRDRNGEFTVLNLMDVAGTFRIEIVNFTQDEQGVYKEQAVPLNEQFDPKEIVRLSPRQFRIEPGGRQKVRLSLRKPANLPEGEYRFHVKAIRLAQGDERQGADGNSVSVIANIGITIPVVVRHGKIDGQASFRSVDFAPPTQTNNGRPAFDVIIDRQGQASTVGMLEVLLVNGRGQAKQIGQIKNMNIFTDIDHRKVRVPLDDVDLQGQKIKIRYIDSVDKKSVFDEKDLTL